MSLSRWLNIFDEGSAKNSDIVRFWWHEESENEGDKDLSFTFNTDVPKPVFDAAIARAAAHHGYGPSQCQYTAFHWRDRTLHDRGGGRISVYAERVMSFDDLSSTRSASCPILVLAVRRTKLPLYAFPCDRTQVLDNSTRIRELTLRVHKYARLVFEVGAASHHPNSENNANNMIRGMYVQVDLQALRADVHRGGHHHHHNHNQNNNNKLIHDLERTVENTIQVIFMGARPKGRVDLHAES